MRLVLPTGEEGAPRTYELDGVLDLSRITLNETIELKRVTGMDLQAVHRGLGLLDRMLGVPNEALLIALSNELELMEAYRALVWLARSRAGDRAEDGSVLTVEQAVDFPFSGFDFQPDPGDAADTEPDPQTPSTDSEAASVDGTASDRKTRGRSSKTSAAKS